FIASERPHSLLRGSRECIPDDYDCGRLCDTSRISSTCNLDVARTGNLFARIGSDSVRVGDAAMAKEEQDEKPAENNMMVKDVAGVLGMVMAPVLVALGMKCSDAIVATITAKPEPPKAESAPKESPKPDSGSGGKTETAGSAATGTADPAKPTKAEGSGD